MSPADSFPAIVPAAESTNRRDFLQQAAGLAAGAAVLTERHAHAGPSQPEHNRSDPEGPAWACHAQSPLLPTIKLGPHEVTRLIIGGNPIYGYSHFNKLLSQHQTAWHTPDRVVELLLHCEKNGINTWQNSYAERTLADLDKYRAAGGKMHWLCLGKPDWDQHPELINDAAKRKPIGIAPHGALAERLHRQNNTKLLVDLLKRIRDTGVLVGLSAHKPALIELSEEKGWDVDYYMCCLYYLTRPKEEFKERIGDDLPLGEIYLPGDPPKMFRQIKAAKKPCLVYKVLAAGRRIGSPAEVRTCFQSAFENVKPADALIVGMYNQFNDQVAENAAIVRELGARR